jgi:endonuclease YncB( thermonuclease family)
MDTLLASTDKNTPYYGLKGLTLPAKVVNIHDGDTLRLAIVDDRQRVTKVTCRMHGYDSPELKRDMYADDAKTVLLQECTTENEVAASNRKILQAEFLGRDKWGRELVRLHDAHGCINDRLMSHPYNVRYLGGTKPVREPAKTKN